LVCNKVADFPAFLYVRSEVVPYLSLKLIDTERDCFMIPLNGQLNKKYPLVFVSCASPSKLAALPKQKCQPLAGHSSQAEREGFEPPEVLPSTVFKTAAFDRSAISPAQK
jgi:hypothetical protein